MPLIFAAKTARELKAKKITLIAPYLAYMRQDKQFHQGQGITSKYFAALISHYFDNLITIDPHLHRWHSLNDIYSIPTHVLHANDAIASWIIQHVTNPVLIGPDIESATQRGNLYCSYPYRVEQSLRKHVPIFGRVA